MRKISQWLLLIILTTAFLFRIWGLDKTPVSLYWDEMDIGYQAYSILKTNKDYFGNFPFLVVHSFADYRAPVAIYATIPFVALIGLENLSVRLPAAVFGSISIYLCFYLAKLLFKSERIGLSAALLMVFVPWNFQYSRMAFEATILITLFLAGVICFLKGLSNQKWFIMSGLVLGLTLFTYNTAKLFVPLMVLVMTGIFIRKINIKRNFLIGAGIFAAIFLLSLYTTFFLGGGQRFSEISILTDPQLGSKIVFLRNQSATSYTKKKETGMEVRNLDKLIYNKATIVLDRISQNYLKVFSTDFLFISGDPNLRHSTGKFGEFFAIEAISVFAGFAWLLIKLRDGEKNSLFLLFWILLAPLPAVLTREGGTHATRLYFLFPVITLLSAQGLFFIWRLLPLRINKIALLIIIFFYGFCVASFLNYYFGAYRLESAKAFQYGFSEAINKATARLPDYDYVIIDDRRESALMSYLFETKFNPSIFQNNHALVTNIAGFPSDKFGNLVVMKPGIKPWYDIFAQDLIKGDFLLIVSAEQLQEQTIEKLPGKLTNSQKLLDAIYYQTGEPAFYVIESKHQVKS